jgi:ribonuclease Z
MTMQTIKAGNLTIEGTSIAGVCTSLHVPELKVVLDAGILHPRFAKEKFVFLSHCHMDHMGSLLSLAGVRDLKGFEDLVVFAPQGPQTGVQRIFKEAATIGTMKMNVAVFNLGTSDTWNMSSRITAQAFPTHHVIPSSGYLFFSKKQKLKSEFHGLPGPEIGALRKKGVEVTDEARHMELAYATDTTLDVIETSPEVLTADVLVMECTFLGEDVDVQSARNHGHIHIDEIVANADKFENKHIVLMHFSARYSNDEIQTLVDEKLPASLRERVHLLLPEQ